MATIMGLYLLRLALRGWWVTAVRNVATYTQRMMELRLAIVPNVVTYALQMSVLHHFCAIRSLVPLVVLNVYIT